jgi:RNA polymerase sigma-70 factor (ECF subfamily)
MTFYSTDMLGALRIASMKKARAVRYGRRSVMPRPGDSKLDLDDQRVAGPAAPPKTRAVSYLTLAPRAPDAPAGTIAPPPGPPAELPPAFQAADLVALQPGLLRRAWLLTGRDRARAADLVQDTFERALCSLHRLLVGSNLRAWLHATMRHRYRDTLRRAPMRALAKVRTPMEKVTAHELRRALRKLSPELRAVFEHRELDQLTYEQIAEKTGVPETTVGSRLNRARAQLRQLLSRDARRL